MHGDYETPWWVQSPAHTLMDMRTDLTAVPHAGLGFHFPRVSVGSHRNLGVFKRKGGPKRKIEVGEQVEVTT